MTNKNSSSKSMIFESLNYKLLILGLLLVIAGFTAMYIENEVYGIISLYISPIVIIAGYVVVIFSILVHTDKTSSNK
ncbi:MAG TPA: hypothetical protein VK106_05725 [Balneolaceae bacterium]|nr:hypothetical protein [Balneolaceae bacterium]